MGGSGGLEFSSKKANKLRFTTNKNMSFPRSVAYDFTQMYQMGLSAYFSEGGNYFD